MKCTTPTLTPGVDHNDVVMDTEKSFTSALTLAARLD